MSSTQGSGEHWKSLESVGISRKELAMAEALQMEYDALSRLRHDKEESRAKQNTDPSLISWDEPVLDFYSKPAGRRKDLKLLRGLSGSDPTLNYNSLSPQEGLPNHSTSQGSQPGPDPWPKGSLAGDYLYIFDGSDGGLSLSSGPGDTDDSFKKLSPPPLPPRVSIWDTPPLPPRKGSPSSSKISQPNDINTFSLVEQPPGKLLGHRLLEEEEELGSGGPGRLLGSMDYDGINDAITRLNLKSTYDAEMLQDATRGWKEGRGLLNFGKDTPGKPVARSKTMPPQVPPRTYTSRYANRKNGTPGKNLQISAALVRTLLCFFCPLSPCHSETESLFLLCCPNHNLLHTHPFSPLLPSASDIGPPGRGGGGKRDTNREGSFSGPVLCILAKWSFWGQVFWNARFVI